MVNKAKQNKVKKNAGFQETYSPKLRRKLMRILGSRNGSVGRERGRKRERKKGI